MLPLLDEATAAAEAMTMFYDLKNKRNKGQAINQFLVSDKVFPQTIDVLTTRAEPLGIQVVVQSTDDFDFTDQVFGVLLQYPAGDGAVEDYRALTEQAKAADIFVGVAADILSLTMLTPPGEWGADVVVGNTQRFGVPMGFGGPHAAFFATKENYKRQIPGRIIGVSVDRYGKQAFRMALQTREQHIRREKATSNICTAQALLAIIAGMYAAYHGPKGLLSIAERVHATTALLNQQLQSLGLEQRNTHFFDTLSIVATEELQDKVKLVSHLREVNFHYDHKTIQISLDETTTPADVALIVAIFAEASNQKATEPTTLVKGYQMPEKLVRTSTYLEHPVFNSFHTETAMMRYLKRLENRDLSLTHSMIPLGSCTMKLNAASELLPVSWPAFAHIHPFAPSDQVAGYKKVFQELEEWLSDITGFEACSLQPNSGAQGEYTGLLTIRAYHLANGDAQRRIALIPSSAHGTNPASAVMAGMKVVVVTCDDRG